MIRADQKLDLTDEENLAYENINTIAVQFAKNKENKEIKKQQIIDGLEPNLDEGWEKNK